MSERQHSAVHGLRANALAVAIIEAVGADPNQVLKDSLRAEFGQAANGDVVIKWEGYARLSPEVMGRLMDEYRIGGPENG